MAPQGLRVEVPFDALDLSTVAEFAQWCRETLVPAPASAGRVVLDFEGVELVTAAGVQALCDLDAELGGRGLRLGIAAAAPVVVRVLEICDLADRWVR
jgi:anti-anti-sigma regulatory factor